MAGERTTLGNATATTANVQTRRARRANATYASGTKGGTGPLTSNGVGRTKTASRALGAAITTPKTRAHWSIEEGYARTPL